MAHFFAALLALLQPAAPAANPLDARWVTPFESPPLAAPGFDAATAYVPLKGEIVAINLDRGTTRWRIDASTTLTPATGDGLVFLVLGEDIEAREAQTGALRWRTPLPGGVAVPLYWDTGWLLASTTAGDLAALRAHDGTLVWRRPLGAPLSGRPGPALDRLYLPLADRRVVAVRLESGETVWTKTLPAAVTSLLALDDQIVFGTAARKLVSVDPARGRERWTWDVGGDVSGTPAADDKRIYYAARDNVLRAIDRGSGNLKWKATLPSRPAGGPLRLPEALLMPLVSREILGFDPETGVPTVTITAAGELGAQPHFRPSAKTTSPQLITVSREGQLQGFGRRFEPVPQLLEALPGSPAVP